MYVPGHFVSGYGRAEILITIFSLKNVIFEQLHYIEAVITELLINGLLPDSVAKPFCYV